MKSVNQISEYHLIIKKSEFICTLIPCDDENKVTTIINEYKEKYHDASHNCVAYIVGSSLRANDDGEPSGTAGLPMLNVLQKQELTNIIAIVTRYFGGIKLGAGGLTRAYSQAVSEALKEADIVEKELVDIYDKDYLDQVTYRCYIRDFSFFDTIQDLTSNQYKKEFIKKEYVKIK